jgi:hypothetical protein
VYRGRACAARLFTPCPTRSITPLVRVAGSRAARGTVGTARGDSWKGDRSMMGHGTEVSPSPARRGYEGRGDRETRLDEHRLQGMHTRHSDEVE